MPSKDKRWLLVDATMRRHGYSEHCLIEALHTAQESFAFLDEETLRFIANSLNLPLSKVYGVATFYNHFTLKPQGKHTCVVCLGTACYIKGSAQLISAVEKVYSVKAGGTTKDSELSLVSARCIGSCGLAPAAVVDGEVLARATPDATLTLVARVIGQNTSTRKAEES
jgi:bidirectional [NiFe] hydrogenase diaphorase subunit